MFGWYHERSALFWKKWKRSRLGGGERGDMGGGTGRLGGRGRQTDGQKQWSHLLWGHSCTSRHCAAVRIVALLGFFWGWRRVCAGYALSFQGWETVASQVPTTTGLGCFCIGSSKLSPLLCFASMTEAWKTLSFLLGEASPDHPSLCPWLTLSLSLRSLIGLHISHHLILTSLCIHYTTALSQRDAASYFLCPPQRSINCELYVTGTHPMANRGLSTIVPSSSKSSSCIYWSYHL